MPNYGFKTVTLREDVYEHLKIKSEIEGLTIARYVARLAQEAASEEEANKMGIYQSAYSVNHQNERT